MIMQLQKQWVTNNNRMFQFPDTRKNSELNFSLFDLEFVLFWFQQLMELLRPKSLEKEREGEEEKKIKTRRENLDVVH